MKTFRTVVNPSKASFSISHKDRIISIGSCFSENIGKKFQDYKFKININPFGQQYNPYSIANAIQRLIEPIPYASESLVFHNELYHSFDHHGSFSKSSVDETLQGINDNLLKASADLKTASIILLTFGTSHIFSLKEGGKVVSNCHQLAGNHFDRRLMKPSEIIEVLNNVLKHLADKKIILTVSPVRYFAFGHYENSVSKGHLFTAIHELIQQYPNAYYFPAYELVIDDLRDYRFFSEDMLHPNYQATDYVWESLCNTMFDRSTIELMKTIDEVLLAAKHKPRNARSDAHRKFAAKYLNLIEHLTQNNKLDFTAERAVLAKFLKQE